MTTHDHLRLVYIRRLMSLTTGQFRDQIAGETDEEIGELNRVALDNRFFEISVALKQEADRRAGGPATLGVAKAAARITYPQVFTWICSDCEQRGEVTVVFPCHPQTVADQVNHEHRASISRRSCMCPGHYLSMKPKPLSL